MTPILMVFWPVAANDIPRKTATETATLLIRIMHPPTVKASSWPRIIHLLILLQAGFSTHYYTEREDPSEGEAGPGCQQIAHYSFASGGVGLRRGVFRCGLRQENNELGAAAAVFPRGTGGRDDSAVLMNDLFRHPESKAGAGVLLRGEEGFEHPLQIGSGNAG